MSAPGPPDNASAGFAARFARWLRVPEPRRKGGHNSEPSQVVERPAAPAPMARDNRMDVDDLKVPRFIQQKLGSGEPLTIEELICWVIGMRFSCRDWDMVLLFDQLLYALHDIKELRNSRVASPGGALPKTKIIQTWRINYAFKTMNGWEPRSATNIFTERATAEKLAADERWQSDNVACVRVVGPFDHEVPE